MGKLNVNNARLTVEKVNSSRKPRVYDKVNIEVTNLSATSQFPFKLTALLPGGGDADISGKAGPINSADAAKTPFETEVKVNNMNIGTYGFIDPASGITGLANFDGTLTSNGSQAKAIGTFKGTKLTLAPKGTPAPKTVVIKHTVDIDLANESGTLTQGDISIGKAQAHLTGTFRTQGETEVVNLKLNAPAMPVEELEAMAPSLGIVLPTGSQLKGGTLTREPEHCGAGRQAGHYRASEAVRYQPVSASIWDQRWEPCRHLPERQSRIPIPRFAISAWTRMSLPQARRLTTSILMFLPLE